MSAMTPLRRNITLGVVIILIGASVWYLQSIQSRHMPASSSAPVAIQNTASDDRAAVIAEKAKKYPRASEITNPSGFINTDAFHIQDLIGKKVILIDFWTYSCINCQRTMPYVNAWYDAYQDQGLEIIGVHTPEFQFEHDSNNVKAAMQKFGIKYPVVLDNNYGTWNAYQNLYWPRKYLIDIDGFIVYDHAGEGAYEEAEKAIQDALKERAQVLGEQANIASGMANPKNVVDVDAAKVGSPETYFGSARNQNFGNGMQYKAGVQSFALPSATKENSFYLDGTWNIQKEYAQNTTPNASITYTYRAKHVYFVAGATAPTAVQVYRDGVFVKTITAQANQLYSLIDEEQPGAHTLKLNIETPGLQAFTFTFG